MLNKSDIEYIKKEYPEKKISLFIHNTFYSKNSILNNNKKEYLLYNCDSIVFVSNFLRKQFFNNLNIYNLAWSKLKIDENYYNYIKKSKLIHKN